MIDPANDPLRAAVAGVLARDVHGLTDGLALVSTEELITARNLLDAAIAEHVQVLESRAVTVTHCAMTTQAWLVFDQHLGVPEANRLLSVARMLPSHVGIADALHAGRMNLEHAKAIAICLRKTDPELRDVVEKELVKLAEDVDPATLARFAKQLCDRLGGNEHAEAAAQRRYASRWVRMTGTYDGMHRIDGMLDPESAAIIKAALNPLLGKLGPEDERTLAQRMADGLVTIAELAIRTDELPELGGTLVQRPRRLASSPRFASAWTHAAVVASPTTTRRSRHVSHA